MPQNFAELIAIFLNIILRITPIVISLSLLAFVWGLAKFIGNASDTRSHEAGKNLMIWGLVALFVMFSVWGIIRLAYNELGFTKFGLPLLPAGNK